MSNKKQSSVEWFAQQLYEKMKMQGDGTVFDHLLEQAKEKHEQEIRTAWLDGSSTLGAKNAEQYYNETFNSKTAMDGRTITMEATSPGPFGLLHLGRGDFGSALQALKQGHCVSRSGWNGKNMFLYHVPANKYPYSTDAGKAIADENGLVEYGAYIAMKTAQGNVVPWLASQTDVLAEDWTII